MTVRLSRLERYYEAGRGLVVLRISKTDFEAVLDSIAIGMVVLRTRFSHHRQIESDSLRAAHRLALDAQKASVKTEVDALVEQTLEDLTRPN
jgi:hypothetical protein